MTATVKDAITNGQTYQLSSGAIKFLRDVWSILEMKLRFLLRGWVLYLIRPLVFPLAIFFWLRLLAPDDTETARRMLTGALIFGFSITTANLLAQNILIDRFSGRLKLLITMPMSKAAYGVGVLAYVGVQAIPTIVLLLALAAIAGVDYKLTWQFFPLIVSVLLTLAGLTFIIVSYAPSQEAGSILSNLSGILLVIISPVFFSMEQAPLPLQWLGWISPMRYAADGFIKSFSGRGNVWMELAVVAGFATATMSLGLWKLRWRET